MVHGVETWQRLQCDFMQPYIRQQAQSDASLCGFVTATGGYGLLCCCCRCSSYASELVAPGLLQLADALISTRCSSPLHVVLAMKQQGGACSLPQQAPAAARAVVLGLQLLQEVFAEHEEARGEVLKVVQVGSDGLTHNFSNRKGGLHSLTGVLAMSAVHVLHNALLPVVVRLPVRGN